MRKLWRRSLGGDGWEVMAMRCSTCKMAGRTGEKEMWVIFPIYNPCPTVKIAICSFLRQPLVSSWLLVLIFPLLWWGYTSRMLGSSPTCQDSSGDEKGTSAYGGSNQGIRFWGGGFAKWFRSSFPEIVWKNSLTPWLKGVMSYLIFKYQKCTTPKFLTWKPKIGGLVCRCFSFSPLGGIFRFRLQPFVFGGVFRKQLGPPMSWDPLSWIIHHILLMAQNSETTTWDR